MVNVDTVRNVFNGMIYPMGLSKNSTCMAEFSQTTGPVHYRLPLRSCNTMSTQLVCYFKAFTRLVAWWVQCPSPQAKSFAPKKKFQMPLEKKKRSILSRRTSFAPPPLKFGFTLTHFAHTTALALTILWTFVQTHPLPSKKEAINTMLIPVKCINIYVHHTNQVNMFMQDNGAIEFFNTIIVQPHRKLVTNKGRGFHVRCRYQPEENTAS